MPIDVILPDGSKKSLPDGSNAMDLATAISPGLAKQVVVARVDDQVQDLRIPLKNGQTVKLFKADSPEGIDTLRHSAEHVLATAVTHLFPGVKVTMGPVSHADDFYYDFDLGPGKAFTPDDLKNIQIEMQKIIAANTEFSMKEVSKAEAFAEFDKYKQNNEYKHEILGRIPDDARITLYSDADFVDLCRGPHLPHAGFIKGLCLVGSSGAYWRADATKAPLQRIRGIAFPSKQQLDDWVKLQEEAQKRDHRRLGKELDLFIVSEHYGDHAYTDEYPLEVYLGISAAPSTDTKLVDFCMDFIRRVVGDKRPISKTVKFYPPPAEGKAHVDARLLGQVTKEQREQLTAIKAAESPVSHTHVTADVTFESNYSEEVGPGLVLWLPKGGKLRRVIEDQWRKMHDEGGYEIVFSPHIAKTDLWKVSGHWNFYRDSMFSPMSIDGHDYVCKPMNCPFHIMMVKSQARSYRELPMRLAELGTVYRYELAGVLHGLMRVRGFTQDDAHLFCRWDQVDVEIDRVIGFVLRVLRTFGFNEFEVNLSTRPEKYVGALDAWARAEQSLEAAIKRHNLKYEIDPGGGAFYGPKIDVKLTDCLGRKWQCSTVQLDFNNPQRFEMEFTNSKGEKEQPVMIHRALLGSIERFIGILVEQYAGAFPAWLSPEQVRVVSVTDDQNDYARKVADSLVAAGVRAHFEEASMPLKAKIRDAWTAKVPALVVVGQKDVDANAATLNLREAQKEQKTLPLAELVTTLKAHCAVPVVT